MQKERVIGYIRVSTDEQALQGVSLEAQTKKIESYCIACDLELVEIIADEGQSAKTLNRPGLQNALQLLKQKQVQGIVVTKLDRLSRSVRDFAYLVESYFAEGQARLLSVGDSIDTKTAAGRLVLNILVSVSQWEREAIGERTKDAMSHLKTKGIFLGSAALGKRYSAETDDRGRRKLEQDPTELALLQRIYNLREQGFSYAAIANHLNQERIPSKRGSTWLAGSVHSVYRTSSKYAMAWNSESSTLI